MHIQVRSKPIGPGGFDENDPTEIAVTQDYQPGVLLEMLSVLKDAGFNLRAAGGPRPELGGEFAFWVGDPEKEASADEDHEAEAHAAVAALKKAGYDAWPETVHWVVLDDRPGTLRDELREIAGNGYLVEEILIGTPGKDTKGGIPVQLRLARLNG